ncbi:MAG: ribosome maturation factor RimM [Bacilli bacterium]
MYKVGKIIGTHGIKGELKVKSETDFDRFKKGSILFLKQNDKYTEIKINSHRVHKGFDLITFNNLDNINLVLEFVGLEIYTTHSPSDLDDDEYFIEDLVGMKVVDQNNINIGIVVDMLEVPQGHILEINNNGKKSLIPFVGEFIKEINDDVIVVETIEGLL